MENLLKETELLNYNDPQIQKLISGRGWRDLSEKESVLAIYNYVRDEIPFGYNVSDNIKATDVLNDNYGQCNTKGILFMALLRAVNIPCRIHGFYIDKIMQKGAMKSFYYALAPRDILHSWVEVFYNGKWLNLEGFILDVEYLSKLQEKFNDCNGSFCGYGVAISDFKNPPIDWNENDTYIQKDGITKDLGICGTPDELFIKYKQKGGRFKQFMFRNVIRHLMNRNIDRIRKGGA
ncbi:MAG: transglutaminase-like domain-containing protein [Oscillospiraceae bacterium]|nr:transglutaminase-like domain-containing protein [Oscillospiraceae bacterium]